MVARSVKIKALVNSMAAESPKTFVAVLATILGTTLAAAALAAGALLSGPVGVELQKPFLALPVSRLTALQLCAALALVCGISFVFLVAAWDRAPGRLRQVCGARWLGRAFDPPQNPGRSVPSWLFWICSGAAILWASWAMLVSLPVVPFVEPDTVSYLRPSPIRSSGYMLVLGAVIDVTGDLKWVVPLQLEAMLLSFLALGWAVKEVLHSQAAGIVVTVVLSLSPGLLILAPAVMTEAVFVALICLHLAVVLYALHRPSWTSMILAGLTLAAIIILRPNGISFLAGVPMLLLFYPRRWRMVTLATLGPVMIVALGQGAYHLQNFGFFGLHRFAGISMVGAAAPLIRADMPTAYPDLAAELERSLAHYARDFPPFEERTYPFEMAHVASLTAVGAIYNEIVPAIRKKLGLPESAAVAFENDPRIDSIAGSLAWSAIRNDPWGFFKIVTSNYIANWQATLPVRVPMSIYYPRSLDIARDVGQRNASLLSPFTDLARYDDTDLRSRIEAVGRAGIRAIEMPGLVKGVFQLLLAYAALALSLWGLIAILRRRGANDGTYRALAYGAVVLQAGYGLISIGNASFTRYTVVFEPVVILVLVAGAVMMLRYVYADSDADSTSP